MSEFAMLLSLFVKMEIYLIMNQICHNMGRTASNGFLGSFLIFLILQKCRLGYTDNVYQIDYLKSFSKI